jgi:hypothetical protein
MVRALNWVKTKSKREIVAFIATGAAAVVTAGFTLFSYVNRDKPQTLKLETKYTICHTENEDRCPRGAIFVQCGNGPEIVAKQRCEAFSLTRTAVQPGGMCGLSIYEMACTSSR